MKIKYALLAAALTTGTAFATTAPVNDLSNEPALSKKRLSGSLTVGAATNYTGRGYVVSHAVAEGDGVGITALKLNYDIGKKGLWTLENTIAYKAPFSGHTLYGNPKANAAFAQYMNALRPGLNMTPGQAAAYNTGANERRIGARNIENEFAVVTAAKYTTEKYNVTMGHDFIRGGLVGVMAKHYRHQGSSVANEFFVTPEWTPYKWLAVGVTTRYSVQGLTGWWFEPYVTLKAPIIGTPEDIKVAGVLTFAMSATADYYDVGDNACDNGTQAFWIQFSTPWFVKKNFIITPSVGFHWLGKGGNQGNKVSHVKQATGDDSHVPFREFGVVGTITATYTF